MCEISVVMPVYNAEMHIKDAIESVLEQSFVDFEFILIDDGSTDRTSSII
ncbi:glycosyltransferase, partial [Enterococcus durans]|nr:glycosyltransferase [Enterococcus durans]